MEWHGNTFKPVAGWTVYDAIAYAINVAKEHRDQIHVEINDIKLTVDEKSNIDDVRNLYSRLLREKYAKTK